MSHVCHKWAVWFWNLFNKHALWRITAQLRLLFCCQGLPNAGCALLFGRYMHMTSVRCWVWPTIPAGPGFSRLSIFCIQALVLHRNKSCTNGVRVHSTVTGWGCQVPQEIGYPLQLRGRIIWGSDPSYLRHRCWAKRQHFTCLESPPDEAVENHFNRSLWPLGFVLSTWTPFFGLSWAACGTLNHFPRIWNLGEFRWIRMNLEIFRYIYFIILKYARQ